MEQMSAVWQSSTDHSLEETLRHFNEAFNRRNAKEVASFWTDDGTLLNPIGNYGEGRAGVERVFTEDAASVLRNSTAKFSIMRARPVGDGALLDLDLELQGGPRPDGGTGPVRMHVMVLARREGGGWKWVDVRPYVLMPRPSVH